jgi:hypothetical protein
MLSIMLTAVEMKTVMTLLESGYSKKIDAIKVVRSASRHATPDSFDPTKMRTGVGLKEAKEAVELLMADLGIIGSDGTPAPRPSNPSARIVPFQPIKKIVCDFGEGEIELDMESMSLRVLTGLNGSMRIQDAMALIDLYQRVKGWEDGLMGACKPAAGVV